MSVNLLFLHFAGFLLQTLPFAFLACLPFLNHLIYGGKKQIAQLVSLLQPWCSPSL